MPIGQASNPILQKAEQALIAKVPQQMQQGFQQVVTAGLHILYSPQLQQQLTQKLASGNPVQDAAQGAVRMVLELSQQSGNKIPPQLMMPLALIFAFEYLDLAAKAGKIQITPKVVAQVSTLVLQVMQQVAKQAQSGQPGAQPCQPQGQPSPAPAPGGMIGSQMGAQ